MVPGVGILSVLGLARSAATATPSRYPGRNGRRVRSPYTTSQLESVVFADVFGTDSRIVTRAEAMSVPAVAKARHLIVSLARQPLRQYVGAELAPDQPAWLSRSDSEVSPQARMAWTLDDHFFSGWSLWWVDAEDPRGDAWLFGDAVRISPDHWSFADGGQVLVDSEPVDPAYFRLIPGPYEGLLEAGARTVRAARNLEAAWAKRVAAPIPLVTITQTSSDDELELYDPEDPNAPEPDADGNVALDEGQRIVAAYLDARKDPNGAACFVPYGYKLEALGNVAHELFVEGRNAVTLDVARFACVPANLLDASLSTASLTYTTQEGNRSAFYDMAAPFWLGPIEARLSMDDMSAPGSRVAFDLAGVVSPTAPTTAPTTED